LLNVKRRGSGVGREAVRGVESVGTFWKERRKSGENERLYIGISIIDDSVKVLGAFLGGGERKVLNVLR
jgi:hypothetical protein